MLLQSHLGIWSRMKGFIRPAPTFSFPPPDLQL